MYTYTQGHSRVAGTGIYLPEQRVTTRDLMREIDSRARFGVSEDWLERVTGIREKRASSPGVLPSDMAVAAAKEALERANITPHQIDVIIYSGLTRDHLEPATAHIVQAKLGATNATVFDVSNACHGFMNGVHIIDALIATGQVLYGLVVTGEQGSVFANKTVNILKDASDRAKLASLAAGLTLGDAGAAMVLRPGTTREPMHHRNPGRRRIWLRRHAEHCGEDRQADGGNVSGVYVQPIELAYRGAGQVSDPSSRRTDIRHI
jgi:3-oxoacyl-[acyl-carrier-protein] synthase III